MFPNLKERATCQVPVKLRAAKGSRSRALLRGARAGCSTRSSEGLPPVILQKVAERVHTCTRRGCTIVMVEQNFRFAAPLAALSCRGAQQVIQPFSQAELASRIEQLHEYLGA